MKMRTVLEGLGAALLLLFFDYLPFINPQSQRLYHHGLPVANLIGGLLIDLFAVTVLTICFLVAIQLLSQPVRRIIEAMFAGLVLWSIVEYAIQLQVGMGYLGIDLQRTWEWSAIPIPVLLGLLVNFLPRIIQPALLTFRLALASFAFSALWIVPQLIHLALVRLPIQSAATNHLIAPVNSSSNQRIVWILFDELSYDQTFDHRDPSIKLPNLDRLRGASVSFSNLKPAGYRTASIIPSLFLGHRFDKFRSTTYGELSYWDESQRRWIAYDPNATLFGLAQQNGWRPGVDGWFNPYCRILESVLNVCYSYVGPAFPLENYGALEEKSMLSNSVALANQLLAVLTHYTEADADADILDYRNIMTHTQALIDDNQIRFVFFHLPIPHPPGIYDRRCHMLHPGGDYLDNLVLADDTLGILMEKIDASPPASQTTVIVTSDHSWRVPMWRPGEDWTDEEERVSEGKFDDRPVLLIHFPDQKSGQDIHTALPEMLEHDMIAGMLLGRINNSEDLDAFLSSADR